MTDKKATAAVPGRRLRKLDEANGQIAHNETHFDEQTDNGLMTERTGQVHHGTKQDIVRQWLEGAEQAPPTGAFTHCTRVFCMCCPPGSCMNCAPGKENKRKDYAFQGQLNEKPSIIPGCPGMHQDIVHACFVGIMHQDPLHRLVAVWLKIYH